MLPDPQRKPLAATLRETTAERRKTRLQLNPCSACGRDEIRVMLRTEYVLYLRCEHCLAMRTACKPGYEGRFGT